MSLRLIVSLSLAAMLTGCAARSGKRLPVTPAIVDQQLLDFHRHYDPMFRTFFGCPLKGGTDMSACKPLAGGVDGVEWRKAREIAKALFQLN